MSKETVAYLVEIPVLVFASDTLVAVGFVSNGLDLAPESVL